MGQSLFVFFKRCAHFVFIDCVQSGLCIFQAPFCVYTMVINETLGCLVISASSRERGHGQRVLLINRVQLFSAHSLSDELKLFREGLAAVCHADIRDVGAADVVAHGTLLRITGAQPIAFGLEGGETT